MNASPLPSPSKVGRTVHLLGTLITFKATAAETDGTFSLVEVAVAPGQGAPPHLQRGDTESFLMLEGHCEFLLGERVSVAGPGSVIHVPPGMPHAFRNVGETPARMLIVNVPGGLHENFFAEAGDAVADPTAFPPAQPPDVPKLIAAGVRYGIEMLPPA